MKRLLGSVLVAWLILVPPVKAEAEPVPPSLFYQEGQIGEAVPKDSSCSDLADRDPFTAGTLDLQAMAGYFNTSGVGAHGPSLDYSPIGLRVGCILDTPCGDDWYRGCIEALVEVNYSPISRVYGHYIVGPDAILRYNFVQPGCLVIPYVQAGAGFNFNDAWRTPVGVQSLLGQEFEFLLRAEVGARVMVTERISLDFEVGFQHISNAGLSSHNGGINNVGGALGFTYFFGKWR